MAEYSHDPGSIDRANDVSILFPSTAAFLTKRIADHQELRRKRLQTSRAVHTYEDLEPYTCTYEHCDVSKPFKRKADWLRHENEMHRHVELWVCEEPSATGIQPRTSDACLKGHICKDTLQFHLKEAHKFSDEQAKDMAQECHYKRLGNPEDEQQVELWVCRVSVRREMTSESVAETSDTCLKGAFRKDNFQQHLIRLHKLRVEQARAKAEECHYIKDTDPGNEPCRLCGTKFMKLDELTIHMASHLEEISVRQVARDQPQLQHQPQHQHQPQQKRKQQHQPQPQQKSKRKQQHQQKPKPKPKPKQEPKKGSLLYILPKKVAVSALSLLNVEQQEQETKMSAFSVSAFLYDEQQEQEPKKVFSVSSLLNDDQQEQEPKKVFSVSSLLNDDQHPQHPQQEKEPKKTDLSYLIS
jgi:hypothetical protein